MSSRVLRKHSKLPCEIMALIADYFGLGFHVRNFPHARVAFEFALCSLFRCFFLLLSLLLSTCIASAFVREAWHGEPAPQGPHSRDCELFQIGVADRCYDASSKISEGEICQTL